MRKSFFGLLRYARNDRQGGAPSCGFRVNLVSASSLSTHQGGRERREVKRRDRRSRRARGDEKDARQGKSGPGERTSGGTTRGREEPRPTPEVAMCGHAPTVTALWNSNRIQRRNELSHRKMGKLQFYIRQNGIFKLSDAFEALLHSTPAF